MTAAPRKPGMGRARDGGDHGPRVAVVVDPDNTLMMSPRQAAACEAEVLYRLHCRPGPSSVAAAFDGFRPVWAEEAVGRCESREFVELVKLSDGGPVYRLTATGLATIYSHYRDIRPQ